MNRIASFLFLSFCGLLLFSSCECEDFHYEGEEIEPYALLTDGDWNLDSIVISEIDNDVILGTETQLYGLNTDNGECTFSFDEDRECVMVDDEEVNEDNYRVYSDSTLVIGEEVYRIEGLSDGRLDLIVNWLEEGEGEEERMCFTRK